MTEPKTHTIGWIGTGRMGFPMAEHLAKAGVAVTAYNRTRAKAEPLTKSGAKIVNKPSDLAGHDIVFTIVTADKDVLAVTTGADGVLSDPERAPKILIDCSTISEEASAQMRAACDQRGVAMLAAPVSGNGKAVKAGLMSFAVSGPRAAFDTAKPYLEAMGRGAVYVGEGELARTVKICHNLMLGIVAQAMAEITVLAEQSGVPRHAWLDFLNNSVMGSVFSRYKSPAYVNLDFAPTFTPVYLRKDLELGLAAARKVGTVMPLTAQVRELVQGLIGHGHAEQDFATLLLQAAEMSGLKLAPENVKVDDGLSPR
ncbi:MAG TPA: NAD(P)-dependent oxidoreductase [Stellaceae bacterium]|jgi:3-hydroxyisobutyrate dehydrogenase-like beta-hydroxyacid dehydrogenase|nr:NAD(P)-dependent oxidoreductase [Stellaceae bacterium]